MFLRASTPRPTRIFRGLYRGPDRKRKVLAGLASAHANHHLGEYSQRDQALNISEQIAKNDVRLREAWAIVAAEMYLDQNRPQDALALLQPLQDASSRYLHATRLLLRAHRQLRNHERVYELARLLLRRGAIEKSEAMQLIEISAAARLLSAGRKGTRQYGVTSKARSAYFRILPWRLPEFKPQKGSTKKRLAYWKPPYRCNQNRDCWPPIRSARRSWSHAAWRRPKNG